MADYDSPWKEALALLFGAFVDFYFPTASPDIDWSRSYENLDKELQQVLRDAEAGKRVIDHLVKVWLKNGKEEWLLIHVEIQSQTDSDFLARLYTYNTRIFDKYQRDVVTFVILADESDSWRPAVYEFTKWGFDVRMRFPTVKLRDIVRDREDLETHPNPFAVLTLAHVRTQETWDDPDERRAWKFRLVKSLYQRGLSPEAVRSLFRCIDWMMNLPKEMENLFWDDVIALEREKDAIHRYRYPQGPGKRNGTGDGTRHGTRHGTGHGTRHGTRNPRSNFDGLETEVWLRGRRHQAGNRSHS
jgi:hypothetical protein